MQVHLTLRNWRSIEEADIELAPFTVLVGRNSSGKSNVVDALLFASEIAKDAETAVSRRGGISSIRRWGPSKPFDISIRVRAQADEKEQRVWAEHDFVIKSGKEAAWSFGKETVAWSSRTGGVSTFTRDRGGLVSRGAGKDDWPNLGALEMPPTSSLAILARQLAGLGHRSHFGPPLVVRSLRPVPDSMRQPQPPSEQVRIRESGDNVTSSLRGMAASARAALLAAMRRIIPGLSSIDALAAGRYLTLQFTQDHGPKRRPDFAATEMSDGALRALAVVVAALQMGRDELLIIEEPEANLHPGAADVIYDVLHEASRRGAVLLTTHSPELLERAKDDKILVCEYVEGVTKVGPLEEAQRGIIREGLFSAADLMRTEELRRDGAEIAVVADG